MVTELLCVESVMLVAVTVYILGVFGAVKWIVCPSRVVWASSDPVSGSTLHRTLAEEGVVAVSEIF